MLVETTFSFFFFIGCLDLLLMTIQDLRTGFIDDRYNYVMMGLVLAMYFVSGRPFIYLVAVLIIAVCFPLATKKVFAAGDIGVLTWMLIGLGILGPTFLYLFFIIFPICLSIHTFFRVLFGIKEKVPGLPILAATFYFIAAVFYLVFDVTF